MFKTCLTITLLCFVCHHAAAFYIPGVTPVSYQEGDDVVIKVNSLTSSEGIMPYPFYSVKTCSPSKADIKKLAKKENIGEILIGEEIEPSLYGARMKVNISCLKVCDQVNYTDADMRMLEKRIEQAYRGNMVLDNLPVAQQLEASPMQPRVAIGYPLGVPRRLSPDKTTWIYNHLEFTIGFHRPSYQDSDVFETFRIVYFYVTPGSIKWGADSVCTSSANLPPVTTKERQVIYTFSVRWMEEPDLVWATRWDVYLKGGEGEGRVHWMSIINSLVILALLTMMVAMIILRTLHKDFNRYNNPENDDEAKEETGWKLVHGDVFRCPKNATSLICWVASGSQLIGMAIATLIFACAGLLSPSNRGGLATAMVLLFVILGGYAGYIAARLFKALELKSWFRIFIVGTAFPSLMLGTYLVLNFFTWASHASSAIPFSTLCLLVGLWLVVSLSLTLVGAAVGYRRPTMTFPRKPNPVPREIPAPRWYMRPEVAIPLGGVLTFGAAFMEFVFMFGSIWQGRVYYVFGILAIVFVIVCVTAAETSIVFIYYQLCYEDYRWWHSSFYICASSGLHLFLFATYYFYSALSVKQTASVILYFGYSAMLSATFAVVTGTIGFFAALQFVRKIYSAIKID